MVYNAYIEGYSNNVFLREHIQRPFKTLQGLKRYISRWKERNKIVSLGHVLYTFSGNNNQKYQRQGYNILEQFNAKAFFEYWNN